MELNIKIFTFTKLLHFKGVLSIEYPADRILDFFQKCRRIKVITRETKKKIFKLNKKSLKHFHFSSQWQ